MYRQAIAICLGAALSAPLAFANDATRPNPSSSDEPVLVAFTWDDVEDGMEDVGSSIERQWERVEDGLFGEDAEERAEEAQERREDAAEEAAERRAKSNNK